LNLKAFATFFNSGLPLRSYEPDQSKETDRRTERQNVVFLLSLWGG